MMFNAFQSMACDCDAGLLTRDKETPLQVAEQLGQVEVAEYLNTLEADQIHWQCGSTKCGIAKLGSKNNFMNHQNSHFGLRAHLVFLSIVSLCFFDFLCMFFAVSPMFLGFVSFLLPPVLSLFEVILYFPIGYRTHKSGECWSGCLAATSTSGRVQVLWHRVLQVLRCDVTRS